MIIFDPQNYPYPSKRNVVYAATACATQATRMQLPPDFRHF